MTEEITLEDGVRKDLEIDDTNLPGELKRQPGKFFYWATLKAKAAQKVRNYKAGLDALKAEKGKEFKDQMAKEDPKTRVTERMLDDFLDTNENITFARNLLIKSQYEEEMLDTAVEALRQRHYAIIELAKSKDTEQMIQNEFAQMKKDFEAREAKKARGL